MKISLALVIILFISCEKRNNNLSRTLLLEQSEKLITANQRDLNGLLSQIAKENLDQKKGTSVEYQKISKLYNELEKIEFDIKKSNRKQFEEIVSQQNIKFKDDYAFKSKFLTPIKVEDLQQLDDEVFKFYVVSKISEFYLYSAGDIFVQRDHVNQAEL
ncbi:hypothetical protein [Flavobacterium limi]|uniref:hypothetical protein n=1 Tax=Flavobacterium limi TaxID=2045105 RepID=UPI0013D271B7|nr:hypothetical protein [Flavobacterium limi]